MNEIPIFPGKNAYSDSLNELRRSVASLRPSHTPGMLTKHTTRGVFRRPANDNSVKAPASGDKPVYL